MRVSSIASAKRAGSSRKPGASSAITPGVKSSASASSTIWLASSSVKTRSANSFAGVGAVLRADARIGRHEGGVERTLGEDRAEMIGQPQRDEERVGDRPGAEDRRQHDVAREAGDAREQREAADGEDALSMASGSAAATWSRSRLAGHLRSHQAQRSRRSDARNSRGHERMSSAAVARAYPHSARRTASTMRSCVGSSR